MSQKRRPPMTDDEIYQRFIEYVSSAVYEFTESEHKMPMITSFIKPEEAQFLTGFEDIANCILFLCSDKANYINGTSIEIDGGLSKAPI